MMTEHLFEVDQVDERRLPNPFVWAVLALSVLPLLLHTMGWDFSSHLTHSVESQTVTNAFSKPLAASLVHNLMEWTAVCVAVFAGLLALFHARQNPDFVVLTIGVTMVFVGPLDAFHILAADRIMTTTIDHQNLVPMTWAISRFAKALMLGVGVALFIFTKPRIKLRRTYLLFVGALVSLMIAYTIVRVSAQVVPLPQAYFPGSWISRPWDMPALLLFLVSGVFLYPHLFRTQPNLFSHALLVAVFPEIATEFHMAFGSNELYDSHFFIAHFLKIVAYVVPLAALTLDFTQAFRREVTASARLAKAMGGLKNETREREQIERQLRSRELRLTQLTESIREVFWIANPSSKELIYISPAYEEIFGRSCESLHENPSSLLDVIHTDDRDEVEAIVKQEVEGDFGFDFRITRPNGQIRWIRARAFPIRNEKGEIYRVAGISEDLTDQKEAEQALRKTETRNRALLSAIPDVLFRLSRDAVFLDYHAKELSQLEISPDEFLGTKVWDFFPTLKEPVSQAIERALDTNALQVVEYPFLLHGSPRDYEARFSKSGDEEVFVIIRDITERKRLEREILEISNREQQRIGHDLHDGLSQQLAGIALLGKVLHQRLETCSLAEAEEAQRIVDLANDAIAQTRRLARGLSPVHLERQGLVAALEELAVGVEHLYPPSCQFHCSKEIFIEDHTVADHLYRIAQEAVNNAVKHADSSRIDIELSNGEDHLTLKVTDNGQGFPQTAKDGRGMGFNIMHYRARMIDASLSISGKPAKGTVVTCKYIKKARESESGGPK